MDPESYVRSCLPAHAVVTGAILSAAAGEAYDSALTDDILRIIVSRLPIKDAVSTTVLSKRWVRLWSSVPPVFYDEQLSTSPESTRVAAVDCILSRHPGPFLAVHISSIEFSQRHLNEWPPLLVDKCVEDLVFVGLIGGDILNYILDSSPMLKVFSLVLIHELPLIVLLRGQNLQCVNLCCFMGSEISVLGYMDAGALLLQIGEIIVKKGTDVRPSTKVWSVRILALKVNFGVLAQLKVNFEGQPVGSDAFPMLRSCTLRYIESVTLNLPSDEQHTEFYEELDLIGCVQSQIKKVVLHDFRCSQSELSFLKYILKTANRLDSVTLVQAENSGGAMDTQLNDLAVLPWGCQACSISLLAPRQYYGWNFRRASDLSIEDPFDLVHGKEVSHFSKDFK
ncbi:uncharacterized protein LOC112876376 [Panicum hallii]|uniref:uncharacterized protein LOC112876376 n=1 Tax=Panicum hallii TaxID=206008 RepID=UPI000DF4DF60|nr:uncharacterized protein LOC112876376 [Panicum hallii]